MKFSREFYFRASFFRAFYFRAPPFFCFRARRNFRATAKKFGFTRLKHPIPTVGILLVFGELKKQTQNMSFKNRAILFSRTFSCANHSNSRGLYIRAGALRENKTHAKISRTKVHRSFLLEVYEVALHSVLFNLATSTIGVCLSNLI